MDKDCDHMLFGEDVPEYSKALELISLTDILIVIGTSLQFYQTAELAHYIEHALIKFIIDLNAGELNSVRTSSN